MKRFFGMLLALALVCVFVTDASAAEGKKGGKGKRMSAEERFQALDKDNDKALSEGEFLANPRFNTDEAKERGKAIFKKMDADGDKKVSLDEYKKAMAEMGKKRGEKKGENK